MLDRIEMILKNNKNVDGYKIIEKKIESSELFFVKKNVDMDRAKSVHHFNVTVYKDIEEAGKKYKGSAETNIHPTMSDLEIEQVINDAAFAARFVKNEYYPLVKPAAEYKKVSAGCFSKQDLPYWMNELTKAVYKNDNYEKGGINSCEIFLNKVYTHIVNSDGVNVEQNSYEGMIEFITTWKEEGEEIELYKCLNFSELDTEAIAKEVENMISICRDKAIAKSTPKLKDIPVLLTKGAIKEFFQFYYSKCGAGSVYRKESTWKIGDKVQGKTVKGDLVTMKLNPFMKNSTCSSGFDVDGLPVEPVTIIENGTLKRYIGSTRFAHYLKVAPTGAIENIEISGGTKTLSELRKEPYLEAAAFSDFTMDYMTGDFCGEIRLAWYFDGEKTVPVTGGSISGNINELQNKMFLSKELQKDNWFEGPAAVKLFDATVSGVE